MAKVAEAAQVSRQTLQAAKRGLATSVPVSASTPDQFVKSGAAAAPNAVSWKILQYVPKPIRTAVGRFDKLLSAVPGYGKLPGLERGFLMVAAAMDMWTAAQDSAKGFMDENGSLLDKVTSGVWSGLKSFGKSAAVLAGSTALVYMLPGLVGVTGLAGLAVGIGGAIAGSIAGRWVLDKLISTHGHVNQQPAVDRVPEIPQSGQDIVRKIDHSFNTQSYLEGQGKGNPWLTPYGF